MQRVARDRIRVAVVGGGAAGLVVARHLVLRSEIYALDLFEQTRQIGGLWAYTDETETGRDGAPVHTCMYKNLITNTSTQLMELPDFPFKNFDGPSFIHHSIVHQYLLDYAQHFALYPHIKLNTLVEHVEPEKLANGQVVWTVSYRDLTTDVQSIRTYDAVIVCNGRYSVGHVPKVPGIDSFKGTAIHSNKYRMPESYAGKNVCILGAALSGIDICLDICKYAKQVYLSHNLAQDKVLKNIEQRSGIDHINGNTFVFRDGSSAQIDVLIYCTGYKLEYPFISSRVEIQTENDHVEPIYKYLVHIDWPSLFFMALPARAITFPMYHIQVQYIMGVLEGRVVLPSSEQMREEYDQEKQSLLDQGIDIRHIDRMSQRQWAYMEEIARIADVPCPAPVLKKILDHTLKMYSEDATAYRNFQYRIVDQDNFIASYHKPYRNCWSIPSFAAKIKRIVWDKIN